MRLAVLAASVALVAISAPCVAAQPYTPPHGAYDGADPADSYDDGYAADDPAVRNALPPEAIEQGGRVVHRMLDALMDVNVGGIEEAVDPGHGPRHRDDTLGDVASRDDPYFADRAHRSVDVMTAQLGQMSDRMARLAPALRRSLHELKRGMKDAMRDLPADDY